jgi:hypothetical protein
MTDKRSRSSTGGLSSSSGSDTDESEAPFRILSPGVLEGQRVDRVDTDETISGDEDEYENAMNRDDLLPEEPIFGEVREEGYAYFMFRQRVGIS